MSDLLSRVIAERDTLREELRQIKAALAGERAPLREIGLTPAQAAVATLIGRAGFASSEAILAVLKKCPLRWDQDGPDLDPDILMMRVHVSNTRKRLRPFGITITNVRGEGYGMNRSSVQKLQALSAWEAGR